MTEPDHSEVSLPGRNPVFATTHWSVVVQAGESRCAQSSAALERLCRTYWYPLFAFIRRKGHAEADAKDLTQQFFARLLERKDFQTVDARKGKFRTFLLASLTHFLANEYDRATALKRGGGKTIFSLDELLSGPLNQFEPAGDDSPANLFDQRWALAVLEQALNRLKDEMAAAGKVDQFELLKTFLAADADDGAYVSVAQKLGVAAASVAVLVHRLRQRYRELVRAEVAQTVASPTELDEEMRHLFQMLNQ